MEIKLLCVVFLSAIYAGCVSMPVQAASVETARLARNNVVGDVAGEILD